MQALLMLLFQSAPGNCPNCIEGQKDKLTYDEWRLKNLERPGISDGYCPGNRVKRIFNGSLQTPPVANKCCCEPVNSSNYPDKPPTGLPE